jgi:hypothetical protein
LARFLLIVAIRAAGSRRRHLDQLAIVKAMTTGRAIAAVSLAGLVALGAGSAEATVYRTIDGTGNNPNDLGAAHTELRRIVPASSAYANDSTSGFSGVNPRVISNTVFDQPTSIPSSFGASNFLFQWDSSSTTTSICPTRRMRPVRLI